jgi:hypothetical protein
MIGSIDPNAAAVASRELANTQEHDLTVYVWSSERTGHRHR